MKAKRVSLSAAKANFYALFAEVRRGREVIVRRAGQPVCILRRISNAKRPRARTMPPSRSHLRNAD
jgi:antitoxin (DNA-binding transcriptional repressor) of toxin-antitoxin stability system